MQSDKFLYIQDESSDELVIIFSGVHAHNFMGYKLLAYYPANKLFIRDPTKSWYNGNISGLAQDVHELKEIIAKVVSFYDKKKVTTFGSSMGAYAALLFGLQLNVGRILVFGAQVVLNPKLPNNPVSLKNIIYPDLSELIRNAKQTQIEYFLGMEEITDFYHIRHLTELSHINIHCVINAPHNVMNYFHSIGQLQALVINFLQKNELPKGILQIDFWQKEMLLTAIIKMLNEYAENQLDKSITELERLLQQIPNWSGGWVFLARMYRERKYFKKALEAATKAVQLNNQLDIAHHELGMVQFAFKSYREAVVSFNYAINLASRPKAVDYIKLCISYRECKEYINAYKVISAAKKIYSNNFGVNNHIGKILELMHQYRASLAYFHKAHQLAPDNKIVLDNFTQAKKNITERNKRQTYKIFFGGDTILTRHMHFYQENNGTQWIVNDLKKLTDEASLSMLNLECIISNKGNHIAKKEYRPYHYRGSPELTEILLALNVSVVFTANNHAVDFGAEALLEQKRYFNKIGIATPGSGENYQQAAQPAYAQVGEYVLGVVSVFTFADKSVYGAEHNKPGVFHETEKHAILNALYSAFIEAKKHADLVVLSPHWTQNWTTRPPDDVIALAHACVDMGYDAILGHSSHLTHGIEFYKNHPIIYDMGTLLADYAKGHEEMPYQAAFMLHIQDGRFNALEIIPIELKNGRTILASGDTAQLIRNNIRARTDALDASVEFVREGERFIVEFNYETYQLNRFVQDESHHQVFLGQFNRTVLHDWVAQKPNIVLSKLQGNIQSLEIPISLGDYGKITNIIFPEAFYNGAGFLFQMVFVANARFDAGRYDVHLLAIHENKDSQFYSQHPVSQGVYSPAKWRKNEVILDKTVISPYGDLKAGYYKLYIGFKSQTSGKFLHSVEYQIDLFNGLVYVGRIKLLAVLRGNYASGLDWSGRLAEL